MLMVTQHAGFGATTPNPTSLEFYLRANTLTSYDSGIDGQKWRNIHTTPTSGASQSAYDVYRGASNASSTDDPTFNGSEGAGNSSNYWSFDGSDYFKSLMMPDFVKNMHKASASFTIGVLLRTPPSFSGTNSRLFSTAGTASPYCGIEWLFEASTSKLSFQSVRADGTQAINKTSTAFATSTVYALVFSIKQGPGSYLRANKAYMNCDGAATWDGTYATPASSDPTPTSFAIGATPSGAAALQNGARLYSIAMYNGWMSEAAADALADAMLTDAGNP